jgi:hypothetical protein
MQPGLYVRAMHRTAVYTCMRACTKAKATAKRPAGTTTLQGGGGAKWPRANKLLYSDRAQPAGGHHNTKRKGHNGCKAPRYWNKDPRDTRGTEEHTGGSERAVGPGGSNKTQDRTPHYINANTHAAPYVDLTLTQIEPGRVRRYTPHCRSPLQGSV